MQNIFKKKIPMPGYRNIKTAIAVFVCIILYRFIDRTGVILAASAALICMQSSLERSIFMSFHRIVGTTIGGLFGIFLVVSVNSFDFNYYIFAFFVAFGIVAIIYLFNLVNKNDSTVIACFVFLVIALEPGIWDRSVTTPILYSFNRVLDTTVGSIIAVVVNGLFLRPNHDRLELKGNADPNSFRYRVKRFASSKTETWRGGVANELYVFPEKSSFVDRNFNWRVSLSTVDFMETTFSILSGFIRNIFVINGTIQLVQDGKVVSVNKNESYKFDGSLETKCIGISEDFNLIVSKDYEGEINKYSTDQSYLIKNSNKNGESFQNKVICSLYDGVNLTLNLPDRDRFEIRLEKNDIFILENINCLDEEHTITVNKIDSINEEIICIAASVRKK